MTALTTVAGFLCAVLSTCVAPEPVPDEPIIELWPPGGLAYKSPIWLGDYGPELRGVQAHISQACADADAAGVIAGLDVMIAALMKITWDDRVVATDLKLAREERLTWQRRQLRGIAEITATVALSEALWRYIGLTPTVRVKPSAPILVDERLGLRPVFP